MPDLFLAYFMIFCIAYIVFPCVYAIENIITKKQHPSIQNILLWGTGLLALRIIYAWLI